MSSLTRPQVADAIANLERRRRADEQRPFAVATCRFTYDDPIVGPVTIAAGERVNDLHHPAVIARPDAFDIVGARHSPRSQPQLNATPAGRPPARDDVLVGPSWALPLGPGLVQTDVAELRGTKSPVAVSLGHGVREAITRHAEAVPFGFETGGLLLGARERDKTIHLTDAWGPGPSHQLKRSAMALDWLSEYSRARRACAELDFAVVAAGLWHVHPGLDAKPSPADLAMFGAALDHASRTVFPIRSLVAVIATAIGRAHGPDLYGWVVRRRSDRGPLVCERAEVRG
jgi:proteasome lid subunit RPN8/RPN11